MTLAYSYARLSSEKQRAGTGLERQKETAALCAARGWTLVEEMVHVGSSFTGRHLRPGTVLGKFLDDIRAGTIPLGSILVVENLDRISREAPEEGFALFLEIIRAGVKIATISPAIVYEPPLGSGLFLALAESMRGHSESAIKQYRGRERWKGNREKAAAGTIITKSVPRWLTADRTTNKWSVDPAKKLVIEQIFTWCIQGFGVTAIVKKLNQAGTPPFETRKRKKGRILWTTRAVHSLLSGRAVLGEYQPGSWVQGKHVAVGDPIPGYYERVIDDETYYLARAAMGGRMKTGGRRAKNKNLFVGLVYDVKNNCRFYCGRKGNGLQLISEHKWAEKLPYGELPIFEYERFETAVLKTLREIKPSDLVPGHKGDRLAELSAQLTSVQDGIAEITPRLVGRNIGSLLDRVEALDAEKVRITEEIQSEKVRLANGSGQAIGEIHGLYDLLAKTKDETDVREKLRGRINLLVERIDLVVLMSERRIAKRRPKAAIADIRFKSGLRRKVLIPYTNAPAVITFTGEDTELATMPEKAVEAMRKLLGVP